MTVSRATAPRRSSGAADGARKALTIRLDATATATHATIAFRTQISGPAAPTRRAIFCSLDCGGATIGSDDALPTSSNALLADADDR